MKINCLSCGFKVDLSDAYDNYQGQVKCYACSATLNVRTEQGDVVAVALSRPTFEIDILETIVREVKPVAVPIRESVVAKAKPDGVTYQKSAVHAKPDGVAPHI